MKYYVLTFCSGLLGVWLFHVLHLPIPWMLGPLFTVFLLQFFTPLPLRWHRYFRDIGLILVGLSLGDYFTTEVFQAVPSLLPKIFILNAVLISFSVVLAYVTAKWCHIDFATALVASVPGGLSQLVIFAEERQSIHVSIVTYFHVVRVILVVSLVPLLLSTNSVQHNVVQAANPVTLGTILLLVIGYIAMRIGTRLRMPVPAFLAPLFVVLLLNFFAIPHAYISVELVHLAQLFVGCHIGLSLTRKEMHLSKRLLAMGVVSAILLMIVTLVTGYGLSVWYDISFATAFLSLAPGGLDQMSVIALSIGGNVAFVTVFQLFRILIIYSIVLPALQHSIK